MKLIKFQSRLISDHSKEVLFGGRNNIQQIASLAKVVVPLQRSNVKLYTKLMYHAVEEESINKLRFLNRFILLSDNNDSTKHSLWQQVMVLSCLSSR